MRSLTGITHLFILAGLIFTTTGIFAQYIPRAERGDPIARRRSVTDANAVRTTLFNYGMSGRTAAVPEEIPYEWPRGTHQNYIAFVGMFIGGEVVNIYGDTIQIVDVPTFRESPNGESWNFEPVPEYQNLTFTDFARSDDPTTWPAYWPDKMNDPNDPGWPGSWNSLWGKNVFFAEQEFYYHISDDLYNRYAFYPDSTDFTRQGLGIVVSRRVMEFDFFQDAVFFVSDIYNAGTTDIEKAAVTMWIADLVGSDGDSNDDFMRYNLADRVIYFLDQDGIGNQYFGSDTVGVAALAFLQNPYQNLSPNPLELDITNIRYDPAGGINFNTVADSALWNRYMTPGHFDPPITVTGDYDVFTSVSYFPLPAGQHQRLITAMIFGKDTVKIKQKLNRIKAIFPDIMNGTPTVPVTVLSPSGGQTTSGQFAIQWNAQNNDPSLNVSIFLSRDLGETYKAIAWDLPNTGSYLWDTTNEPDGIFNKLKFLAVGDSTFGMATTDSVFTINNPVRAEPQIMLTSPQTGQTYQNNLPVEWIAGDADDDSIDIDLSYSVLDSVFSDTIVSGLSNTGFYNWNISHLPNSSSYNLQARAHAGQVSSFDVVSDFEISNPRDTLSGSAQTQRHTIGTGLIEVHVVNPSDLNGHNYRVQFNVPSLGTTTYDVIDETSGMQVVTGASQVNGLIEGPLFDGIRLLVQNDSTSLNTITSGWNHSEVYGFDFDLFFFLFVTGIKDPSDYRLEIGNVGIDTSKALDIGFFHFPSKPVNFKITNLTTGEPLDFAFLENHQNDGRFTVNPSNADETDLVIFLAKNSQDSLVPSWSVFLNPYSGNRNPQPGDTLSLNLYKAFQDSDYYSFEALPTLLEQTNQPVNDFMLYPNYPNPFNPETTIRFRIGNTEKVRLLVYDILGRKIRSLMDRKLTPGSYTIKWYGVNDSGLLVASGIYFYQLAAGNFKKTRKMVLIR